MKKVIILLCLLLIGLPIASARQTELTETYVDPFTQLTFMVPAAWTVDTDSTATIQLYPPFEEEAAFTLRMQALAPEQDLITLMVDQVGGLDLDIFPEDVTEVSYGEFEGVTYVVDFGVAQGAFDLVQLREDTVLLVQTIPTDLDLAVTRHDLLVEILNTLDVSEFEPLLPLMSFDVPEGWQVIHRTPLLLALFPVNEAAPSVIITVALDRPTHLAANFLDMDMQDRATPQDMLAAFARFNQGVNGFSVIREADEATYLDWTGSELIYETDGFEGARLQDTSIFVVDIDIYLIVTISYLDQAAVDDIADTVRAILESGEYNPANEQLLTNAEG